MTAATARPVPRLLRRVLDAQYRLYDRMRHPDAQRAAATPGQSGGFEALGDGGYCLLVTFKRDGTPVPTPVMFGRGDDGKVYIRCEPTSWKAKRARRDPHVRLVRCNARGKPKSPTLEGRARILPPEEEERARRILWDSYSVPIRIYEGTADRLPVQMLYLEVSP